MSNEEMAERIRAIEARLFGRDYVDSTDAAFKERENAPAVPEEKKEA